MQVIQLTEEIKKEIFKEYCAGAHMKALRAKYPLPRGTVKSIVLAGLSQATIIPETADLSEFLFESTETYKDVDDTVLAAEFPPEGEVFLESSSTITTRIEPANEPAENYTETLEAVEIPTVLTDDEPAKILPTDQAKSVAAAKALAKRHKFKKTV